MDLATRLLRMPLDALQFNLSSNMYKGSLLCIRTHVNSSLIFQETTTRISTTKRTRKRSLWRVTWLLRTTKTMSRIYRWTSSRPIRAACQSSRPMSGMPTASTSLWRHSSSTTTGPTAPRGNRLSLTKELCTRTSVPMTLLFCILVTPSCSIREKKIGTSSNSTMLSKTSC